MCTGKIRSPHSQPKFHLPPLCECAAHSVFYTCRHIVDGPRPMDVHPSKPAIAVHYEIEAAVISEYGEPMAVDRKQARKM